MVFRGLLIAVSVTICFVFTETGFADLIDEEAEETPSPTPVVKPRVTPKPRPKPTPKSVEKKPQEEAIKPDANGEKITTGVLAPKKKPSKKKKKSDGNKPVHFTCVGLKGQRSSGVMELLEDVVVTQEDLKITSNTATIYFDQKTNETTKVMAKGNVKIFKIDEGTGEKIKAHANQAVFHNDGRKIILKGNARLWRGPDLVRGKQIIYELDSGWIRASRVEGVVQPGEGK